MFYHYRVNRPILCIIKEILSFYFKFSSKGVGRGPDALDPHLNPLLYVHSGVPQGRDNICIYVVAWSGGIFRK